MTITVLRVDLGVNAILYEEGIPTLAIYSFVNQNVSSMDVQFGRE